MSDDREIGVEAARKRLGPLVDDAAVEGIVTYLTRRGRRFAAIVPLDRVKETIETGGPADEARPAAVETALSGSGLTGGPAAESEGERTEREQAEEAARWQAEADAERAEFERRLRPVPEFGEGYQMAEWPGTGRYYLVHEGERIGHAAKKAFTSRWEAHTAHGSTVPGTRTYGTRHEALAEVALHHQDTTPPQEAAPR